MYCHSFWLGKSADVSLWGDTLLNCMEQYTETLRKLNFLSQFENYG